MAELRMVKVSEVNINEHKMRGSWDGVAFEELKESIGRQGVLQPILVRCEGEGFVVVAGHRRTEAARQLGHDEIPAYVCEFDEADAASAAYAENIFRHDLSPIEEAAAVKDLVVKGGRETEKVAAMLGRSVVWVRERIAICDWPGDILEAVHSGFLSLAAASNLVRVGDDVHRGMLLEYACTQGVTARVTMAWLQSWIAGKAVTNPEETEPAPLGAPVAQLPPHTPCVLCGRVMQMGQMSYQPVCSQCGVSLIEIAKGKLQVAAETGSGEGPG